MIFWYLIPAVGVLLAFLWKASGGRLGTPESETPIEFFARVASQTPPLSSISLPPEVAPADSVGVRRARAVRSDLRWKKVAARGLPFEVFVAAVGGGRFPTGGEIYVTPGVVGNFPGPLYAIRFKEGPRPNYPLADRWIGIIPGSIPAMPASGEATEDQAASVAGAAALEAVGAYVQKIGGGAAIPDRLLSVHNVREIVAGGS